MWCPSNARCLMMRCTDCARLRKAASIGRLQQTNPVLGTPLHELAAVMTCQVIQDEQHAHGREEPIQLLSGWGRLAALQNGRQFLFEPGMQHSIGARIDGLGSPLAPRGPKKGQQFARGATKVLVSLSARITFRLPARPWGGNV